MKNTDIRYFYSKNRAKGFGMRETHNFKTIMFIKEDIENYGIKATASMHGITTESAIKIKELSVSEATAISEKLSESGLIATPLAISVYINNKLNTSSDYVAEASFLSHKSHLEPRMSF